MENLEEILINNMRFIFKLNHDKMQHRIIISVTYTELW